MIACFGVKGARFGPLPCMLTSDYSTGVTERTPCGSIMMAIPKRYSYQPVAQAAFCTRPTREMTSCCEPSRSGRRWLRIQVNFGVITHRFHLRVMPVALNDATDAQIPLTAKRSAAHKLLKHPNHSDPSNPTLCRHHALRLQTPRIKLRIHAQQSGWELGNVVLSRSHWYQMPTKAPFSSRCHCALPCLCCGHAVRGAQCVSGITSHTVKREELANTDY